MSVNDSLERDKQTCPHCKEKGIPKLHDGGYYCPHCNKLVLEYYREVPLNLDIEPESKFDLG